MSQKSSRGVQQDQVWAAADELVVEGLRPTIERVRQKIGSGSPNTVSPMLETWFATLGERLAGGKKSELSAGNDVPPAVNAAARQLWEMAQKQAAGRMAEEAAATTQELADRAVAIEGREVDLTRREEAIAQARAALEEAVKSSHEALEAMKAQLMEAMRLRAVADEQAQRLRDLLDRAQETREVMQQDFNASLETKEEAIRLMADRHASSEHRLLAEVDRARQEALQNSGDLAKEVRARKASEEAGVRARHEATAALRVADQQRHELERALSKKSEEAERNELEKQALKIELQALSASLADEKQAHDDSRKLLGQALSLASATRKSRRNVPSSPAT